LKGWVIQGPGDCDEQAEGHRDRSHCEETLRLSGTGKADFLVRFSEVFRRGHIRLKVVVHYLASA
jgi:hypothetical protein